MASAPPAARGDGTANSGSAMSGIPILGQFVGGIMDYEQRRKDAAAEAQRRYNENLRHDQWLDKLREVQAQVAEMFGGRDAMLSGAGQTAYGTESSSRSSNWRTTPGVTTQFEGPEALARAEVMDNLRDPRQIGDAQITSRARDINAADAGRQVAAEGAAAGQGASRLRAALMAKGNTGSQIAQMQNAVPLENQALQAKARGIATAWGAPRTGRAGTSRSSSSGTTTSNAPFSLSTLQQVLLPQDAYKTGPEYGDPASGATATGISPWAGSSVDRTEVDPRTDPRVIAWINASPGRTYEKWLQTLQGQTWAGRGR